MTLDGERNFQKVQTKATDNAKIKLNDCRLHGAAQIYRTCNWKEMQNGRGLALFGHTRFPVMAAARFPIGQRTMPIVNDLRHLLEHLTIWQKYNMFVKLKREGGLCRSASFGKQMPLICDSYLVVSLQQQNEFLSYDKLSEVSWKLVGKEVIFHADVDHATAHLF